MQTANKIADHGDRVRQTDMFGTVCSIHFAAQDYPVKSDLFKPVYREDMT